MADNAESPDLCLVNSKQLMPDIAVWGEFITYEHSFHTTRTVPEVTDLHSPRGVA